MGTKNTHLIVEAGVRHWEDANVNGVEDSAGTLIPFRRGDSWCPVLDLATGKIVGWPDGTTAEIHYKVCDDGEYWLGNATGDKAFKWNGNYVPDYILCVGARGYGDYIIMKVGADGVIQGWKQPRIEHGDWIEVPK